MLTEYIKTVHWENVQPTKWGAEIPNLLRIAISVTEVSLQRYAVDTLRNHIAHQSGLYGTTLAVIPILFHCLDSPEINDKRWVLELLYVIQFQNPGYSKLHSEVYDAMLQEREKIEPFLKHPNSLHRLFSAHLLSRFVLHADVSANWLISQLSIEVVENVKINLVYCVGKIVSDNATVEKDTLDQILLSLKMLIGTNNFSLACHSLIASIKIRGDETDHTTISQLLDCIKHFTTEYDDDFSPYVDVAYNLCSTLARFKEPLRLSLMIQALSIATSPNMVLQLVMEMMRTYKFQKRQYNEPFLAKLTLNQRQVSESILSCDLFWESEKNIPISQTYLIDLRSRKNLLEQLEIATVVID